MVQRSKRRLKTYRPWWWLAVVGTAYGWRFKETQKLSKIVNSSFLSAFMVWVIFSYYFDARSQGAVSAWLAQLFTLSHSYLVYLMTGILAGFVTAFSSYIGTLIHKSSEL